jgi:hypothetical protein
LVWKPDESNKLIVFQQHLTGTLSTEMIQAFQNSI